jgi:hypothetical protein
MAEKVLKDCKLLVGGYDVSGNTNTMSVTASADVLDKTAYGSSFRKRIHGLNNFEMTGGGFWDSSTDPANKVGGFDSKLFGEVGGTSEALTVAVASSDGSNALLTNGVGASYSPSGNIGELMGFDFAAQGNGAAIWGKLARSSTMKGSSGQGTAVYLGTASTSVGKKFYAICHVIRGTTAGTVDVQIQGDASSDFPSPSTICGFTQLKTTDHHVRYQWATTKASTDHDWYRVLWKASAAGVNVRAFVSIGKTKG